MFFRFRCSRRVFPPVVPGLRFRPAFPSGGAWFAERFRAPPAFAGLVRFCRRFCLAALLRVSVRHFRPAFGSVLPPVIPGLHFRPAFPSGPGLVRGAFPRSACLCGACPFLPACFLHAVTSAYGKKRACRNPDVGLQRCAACCRDRSFEPAGGSVSGGIRAVRAAKLHIIP